MRNYNILVPEEFVAKYMEVYNSGDTISSIAKHYGVTSGAISQRIERYRKLGVELPPIVQKRIRRIDAVKLNNLIEELKNKDTK